LECVCDAGATCPDGLRFIPNVEGSTWSTVGGTYALEGCPPGYELTTNQECSLCPALSYCLGGKRAHVPCPDGVFARPGSNSSMSCAKVVYVVAALTLKVFIREFSSAEEKNLQLALSLISEVDPGDVLVVSIVESGYESTQVISKIAIPDVMRAAQLRSRLSKVLLNPSALAASLNQTATFPSAFTMQSVTVTECPPGFDLVLGSSALNIGSDGLCEDCQASYYCPGWSAGRQACPSGTFSKPGSNSSTACIPAVFVAVDVSLPIPPANFTMSVQAKFKAALASAAGTTPDRVIIIGFSPSSVSRRSNNAATVTQIQSQVAAKDLATANSMCGRLDSAALSSELASQGLPAASVGTVALLNPSVVTDDKRTAILVGVLVGGFALLLFGVSMWLWTSKKKSESEEETILQMRVEEIRKKLHLTVKDGFLLSSERPSFWNRRTDIVFLRKSHLESVARFSMFQDFDVMLFDAFCLSLDSCNGQNRLQYSALCNWILEISEILIKPDSEIENGAAKPGQTRTLQAGERFRYFTKKVCRTRIWRDDPDLFADLKKNAAVMMAKIVDQCDQRYSDLCKEPGGDQLIAFEPKESDPAYGFWVKLEDGMSYTKSFPVQSPEVSSSNAVSTEAATLGQNSLPIEISTGSFLQPGDQASQAFHKTLTRQDHQEVRPLP
jgi:hypothetical protein